MKKKLLLISVLIVLTLILTVPVVAKFDGRHGDRIRLNTGETSIEFPEDTAFHIVHGWGGEYALKCAFEVEIDGIKVTDFEKEKTKGETPEEDLLLFVFNFPKGMTGVHEFTGIWTCPEIKEK